ncbi:transketolase family protein [Mycoplasmopsis agassizii]|uniref:Transketolase n=1 Tax=Mycoplasmopsis agassizii TaxID=33922 RepID=A0ABX4H6G3_9BACT|nr:transketolase [Mycoplasmopsis agassizii]PAF55488.1 transketolase [Mycoplasmopsis agassizii]SMC18105.1 transketolase [Mycoplasmopsis agassizii]
MKSNKNLADKSISAIRVLSAQMVNEAKSGHTGMPLGAAPIMYALFKNHFVAEPAKPNFFNRDRLVLSAGHGSALLYATMHLSGFEDANIEQLKRFRQIDSTTAGHPENVIFKGIDASTGPLGQGVAIATGMAISETKLNAYFKNENLIDHHIYCIFGDACLQEGISFEAFSLAGRYKLNKLIYIYDSNDIQSDSNVESSTNFKTKEYFEALGFNYFLVKDGEDYELISETISLAKQSKDKPSIIEVKTTIGFKTKYQGTNKSHSLVLNDEELRQLEKDLNWNYESFFVPKDVYNDFEDLKIRGQNKLKIYQENLKKLDPQKQHNLSLLESKTINFKDEWFNNLKYEKAPIRGVSGDVLQIIAEHNPLMFVSSADLASSTKMWVTKGSIYDVNNRLGINLNIGVREFAMTAINSGITLHSNMKTINSTFLVFSDYSKAALRLAAISHSPITSVFSHDTVTVGYDGPTHQAVEQLWSLRLIPNHVLFRPANLTETIHSFNYALNSKITPVTIVTSRADFLQREFGSQEEIYKGAYLIEKDPNYDLTILASGSEVDIAYQLKDLLKDEGYISSIVSIPSWNLFNQQDIKYQKQILGNKKIVAVEFCSSQPWYKYADLVLGVNNFGFSASPNDVINKLKLQAKDLVKEILEFLKLAK